MHNIYYLGLSGEHRCPLGYLFNIKYILRQMIFMCIYVIESLPAIMTYAYSTNEHALTSCRTWCLICCSTFACYYFVCARVKAPMRVHGILKGASTLDNVDFFLFRFMLYVYMNNRVSGATPRMRTDVYHAVGLDNNE